MRNRICQVAIAIAFAFGAQAARAENCFADEPMRFYGTVPAVEVTVNQRGKFLFVLDTGAEGIARADTSLVSALGLQPSGQHALTDGTCGNQPVSGVVLDEIRFGNMIARNVTAASRDYNKVAYFPDIAGILGFGFFKDCLLTLDYKARRVRVTPGTLPTVNGRDIIDVYPEGGPFISFSIGRVTSRALIDSGSQYGMLLPYNLVRQLPFQSYKRTIGKGRTVTAEFDINEVALQDTLSIGSYRVPNPVINFGEHFTDSVLGSAALHGLTLTFDQKNNRVRIR
jgi:hypothetical protein